MSRGTADRLLNIALVGVAAVLIGLETLRPLRRRQHEPKLRRMPRNAAIGGIGAVAIQLCEVPVVVPLARYVERRGWGLMPRLGLTAPLRRVLTILALDYTLYVWHVLVHRVPALWRFHRVHHADLDLDVSTAIRFHFGELIASVPWRAAQVALIGVDARTLQLWQMLTLMSVMFHHSNARLPHDLERRLGYVLVTPRLHGIHHSKAEDEANSNWSSGLSVWDRLHGTFRADVTQDAIEIGVSSIDTPEEATLGRMLVAPAAR